MPMTKAEKQKLADYQKQGPFCLWCGGYFKPSVLNKYCSLECWLRHEPEKSVTT